MALPAANNPISLGQIQTEFCGSNPIAITEYYRGGAYTPTEPNVTQNNTNVPTSGTIALSNFYGATRAYIETISFTRNANNQNSFYLNSPGLPTITITTTVNGGGSTNTYYIPANTIYSVTSNPDTSIRLNGSTMELDDNQSGDPDGDYNDLTITPNLGYFYESDGNFYYELNRACDENEFIVRISSTTTNVNVLTLFETTYPGSWTQNVPKRLVISSGVVVGSLDPGAYALTIPGGVVSTLRIDNNGSIQGAGGGSNSGDGGPAILANSAVTIDNIGSIYGGGGGGGFGGTGGGGSYTYECFQFIGGQFSGTFGSDSVGGNGGTGQGYAQNATGGSAGDPSYTYCGDGTGCEYLDDDGNLVSGATVCVEQGIGGAGGTGGAGGSFGNNGETGQTGGSGNAGGGYSGDPGGLAGCYITNNGNVTWVNTGDRRGGVC